VQRIKASLMPLALAVVAFGQTQQPAVSLLGEAAPETAEGKYARQRVAEATNHCAALQAQYEALEAKIKDLALKGSGLEPDPKPTVTACTALQERSDSLINSVKRHNELIDEAHQQWLHHAKRMIGLGAKPKPEQKVGEVVPPGLLRQLSDITETHDRIVRELPALETRFLHADECAAVYKKTIDEKVSELTTRESEQIKACQSAGLYPPDK